MHVQLCIMLKAVSNCVCAWSWELQLIQNSPTERVLSNGCLSLFTLTRYDFPYFHLLKSFSCLDSAILYSCSRLQNIRALGFKCKLNGCSRHFYHFIVGQMFLLWSLIGNWSVHYFHWGSLPKYHWMNIPRMRRFCITSSQPSSYEANGWTYHSGYM